jgi:hypothetical protein
MAPLSAALRHADLTTPFCAQYNESSTVRGFSPDRSGDTMRWLRQPFTIDVQAPREPASPKAR